MIYRRARLPITLIAFREHRQHDAIAPLSFEPGQEWHRSSSSSSLWPGKQMMQ